MTVPFAVILLQTLLAMMVPDYVMIAEIMLFSFGFNNAIEKVVTTFKYSSGQVSPQVCSYRYAEFEIVIDHWVFVSKFQYLTKLLHSS